MAGFSPNQLKAIAFLAEGDSKLTLGQVAKKVGVDVRTIHRWRQDSAFNEAIYKEAMVLVGAQLPKALKALVEKAIKGDIRAIELLLRQTGKLVDKHEISGPDGGPLNVSPVETLAVELAAIAKRRGEAGGTKPADD